MADQKPEPDFENVDQIEKILRDIERTGMVPDLVTKSPGQFVRSLYEIWIENGGKIGGRYNRNSLRRMKNEWLIGEHAVNSLYPKLTGKARLTRKDTEILLGLFLDRWRYAPDQNGHEGATPDGYVAFSGGKTELIIAAMLSAIFDDEKKGKKIQIPMVSIVTTPNKDLQTIQEFVDGYHKSAALFTFSREKTIVGPNPTEMMNGFWHFCNHLYQEDQQNPNIDHQIIWVVDIGGRVVDREDALKAFYNVGFLAMQFVAFANLHFTEEISDRIDMIGKTSNRNKEERKKRWAWLSSRACIFVENLQPEEYEDYLTEEEKKLRLNHLFNIGITADHILPRTVPVKWKSSLRELYGRSISSANDTTFTANLLRMGDGLSQDEGAVKYTAFARVFADGGDGHQLADGEGYLLKSVELMSPGDEHDDGIRLLYRAARHIIKGKATTDEDGMLARAYLMKLGFQAFNLRDFVQIFWSSIDLLE